MLYVTKIYFFKNDLQNEVYYLKYGRDVYNINLLGIKDIPAGLKNATLASSACALVCAIANCFTPCKETLKPPA